MPLWGEMRRGDRQHPIHRSRSAPRRLAPRPNPV